MNSNCSVFNRQRSHKEIAEMASHRIEVITNHLRGTLNARPNLVAAKKYEFTLDNGKLTQDERDFYEKHGYLLVTNLVSPELMEKCRQHFVDICNGVFDKGSMLMMKEIALMEAGYSGENLYNKVQDILHDDVFSQYTDAPEILDYVQCFTGPNIMGMHSMLINKPPGTTRHPPHQDLHYFPFRPENRIVAAWTAMEPVFKENGCLYVIPGSHKGQLYKHEYPIGKDQKINKAYHGIQNEDEIAPLSKRIYVPMETGDTLFFHPLLIHGSEINQTKRFRKAISCHYAGSDCHYIETKGTIQEDIGEEVVSMAKKKGFDIDFKMAWYYRARNVRGDRMNL